MKKHSFPTPFAALVAFTLTAAPALVQGADTLITVEGGTPRASNRCGAQEADFTLRAERPLTIVQRAITGVNDEGKFTYGSSTSSAMKRGDTQKLNACMTEGIPALEICAKPEGGQEQCWAPAYSGEDGSLVLASGFAHAAASAQAAGADVGAGGAADKMENTPRYKNERYGFALTLPPGQWEVRESDNGDGITAKDGESDPKSREIRAWGTNSPGVLGQSLKDVLADAERDFASVTRREVDEAAARFTLAGTAKAGGQLYVRGFVSKEVANIVRVATPDGWQAGFDAAVRAVEASFKPGF